MDTNRQIKDYFQYTKIRSTKSLLLLKAQCYSPNTLSVLLFTKPVNILPDIFLLTRRAVSILAYISFSFMQCHCTKTALLKPFLLPIPFFHKKTCLLLHLRILSATQSNMPTSVSLAFILLAYFYPCLSLFLSLELLSKPFPSI